MSWRRQDEPARSAAPRPAEPVPEAGRPLQPAVRGRMESRLGHDFSSVRIHHSPDEARVLRARAFTVGEDVTFAPGQYAPQSAQGERLLEHELGHVVDHRHGAAPGAYRAPEGEEIPSGPERPLRRPGPQRPTFGVGSLSLGLGTLDGFAFNDSKLTQDHRDRIPDLAGRLVSLMGRMPGGRITVTGHTDLVGGEQVNLDLGHKRAVAVAAALAQAGVPRAMMDIDSAGESAPAIQTQGQEPRNRRVEIRFAGAPIGSEGDGRLLRLGPPEPAPKFDFTLHPGALGQGFPAGPTSPAGPASQRTPATTQPGQVGLGKLDPGRPEPQTKPGSYGDLAKAVAALPDVKKLLEDTKARALKDLGSLSKPEKVLLGTVTGAIAAGVVTGLAADPGARKAVLDFVDGTEIPLPGLRGVFVVPHTKGGAIGGGVTFDIVKIFGGGK